MKVDCLLVQGGICQSVSVERRLHSWAFVAGSNFTGLGNGTKGFEK